MNATGIEYLNFTYSPLVGCSGIGCAVYEKCWARYMKRRKLTNCPLCYEFKPHSHFERLEQPLHVKKPSRIGVCYSADMWDLGFTDMQREKVLNLAGDSRWHWFINLTKQPQNIPKDLVFPRNWIQGVSICNRGDLWRLKELMGTRAGIVCASVEPLYEDLWTFPFMEDLDWVIIGGQTHPLKLPDKEWVNSIIYQARKADVPIFIKNNLSSLGYNMQEYPKFLQIYCREGEGHE